MFNTKIERRNLSLLVCMALAGLVALAAPPLAFSQSCALCYTQAASAGTRMIEALRSGILVLIAPPTLASVAMIFLVRHKDQRTGQGDEATNANGDW